MDYILVVYPPGHLQKAQMLKIAPFNFSPALDHLPPYTRHKSVVEGNDAFTLKESVVFYTTGVTEVSLIEWKISISGLL